MGLLKTHGFEVRFLEKGNIQRSIKHFANSRLDNRTGNNSEWFAGETEGLFEVILRLNEENAELTCCCQMGEF